MTIIVPWWGGCCPPYGLYPGYWPAILNMSEFNVRMYCNERHGNLELGCPPGVRRWNVGGGVGVGCNDMSWQNHFFFLHLPLILFSLCFFNSLGFPPQKTKDKWFRYDWMKSQGPRRGSSLKGWSNGDKIKSEKIPRPKYNPLKIPCRMPDSWNFFSGRLANVCSVAQFLKVSGEKFR